MEKSCSRVLVFACSLVLVSVPRGYGQSGPSSEANAAASPATVASTPQEARGRIAFGVKASLLGGGFEVATPITHRSNLRGGFNILSYGHTFNKDGVAYNGQLGFKTLEAHYDFFPWAGSFHAGPGLLAYVADPITATASVPAGQSFSLGGKTFYSDTSTPVGGHGKIDFNRAAPTATFGWGNLLPRSSKRWSIPFEMGVAFQGSPKATLALTGNACDAPGANCRSVVTDPRIQSQVLAEQTKINNSMSFFKVYPIISLGFGYKF